MQNRLSTIDPHPTESAYAWFVNLRDDICAAFECLEAQGITNSAPSRFQQTPWRRDAGGEGGCEDGGGGVMSIMRGQIFEKVGVNVSMVRGNFSPEFAARIPHTQASHCAFRATGISVVAHMRSPHIPAVHMNTRRIETGQSWFGGGTDMTPAIENPEDTHMFHAALEACCARYDPACYPVFKAWCDQYFYLPHRKEARGVGGIFFDDLDSGAPDKDFAFIQDVGKTFLEVFTKIVHKNMEKSWTEAEREKLLIKRGRYAEFNLLYDRGTRFGLETGGNPEAVLMSLPPHAQWP